MLHGMSNICEASPFITNFSEFSWPKKNKTFPYACILMKQISFHSTEDLEVFISTSSDITGMVLLKWGCQQTDTDKRSSSSCLTLSYWSIWWMRQIFSNKHSNKKCHQRSVVSFSPLIFFLFNMFQHQISPPSNVSHHHGSESHKKYLKYLWNKNHLFEKTNFFKFICYITSKNLHLFWA